MCSRFLFWVARSYLALKRSVNRALPGAAEANRRAVIAQMEALKSEATHPGGIECVDNMIFWARAGTARRVDESLIEATRGYMGEWEKRGREWDTMLADLGKGGLTEQSEVNRPIPKESPTRRTA